MSWRRWSPRSSARPGPMPKASPAGITIKDIIIVAPYNAQVAEIQTALQRTVGERGNVGHRRQVPGTGRGRRHLFHGELESRGRAARHGLPVFTQPAQCRRLARPRLAIVVASPTLLEAGCRTPEQMHQVSAMCSLVEHAARG